jgi:hypothetical protein
MIHDSTRALARPSRATASSELPSTSETPHAKADGLDRSGVLLVLAAESGERARIRQLARSVGFSVCEADRLAVALDLQREAAPDVVLVTVNLSEFETAVRLLGTDDAPRRARRAPRLWTLGSLTLDNGAELTLGPLGDGRELREALLHARGPRRSLASIGSLP